MKIKIVSPFLISALIMVFTYCQSSTEPGESFKDPREMTWTVDTLSPDPEAVQLLSQNILVFNPNDIWMTCYSDVARRLLWHYDGNSWSWIESGGGKRYEDLAGYNADDIWLGGYSGEHPHFTHKDGNSFIRFDYNITGQLLDMTMDGEGNIWACGRDGIIMKYDKTKWIIDTLNMNFGPEIYYWLQGIESFDNEIILLLATSNRITHIETHYYARGHLKNWNVVDSMKFNSPEVPIRWGYRRLFSTGWGSLYSSGVWGVWEYINNNWTNILSVNNIIQGVFGASKNYLFAIGQFREIYFYNGNSWENINSVITVDDPNFVFKTGWTNGKETFIIGYTFSEPTQRIIVWHGK